MGATWGMVEVMWCNYFVFHAFVVQLNCVLRIVTSKYKQVFDRELVTFGPPNFESFLFFARLLFLKVSWVKQIEHFLAVDLQETARYVDCLVFDCGGLVKHVSDSTYCQTRVHFRSNGLHTSLTMFTFIFVLVALHSKSLSWASLAICKNSSVKTINYAVNQPWNLELIENFLLTAATVNDLVKLERFHFFVVYIYSELLAGVVLTIFSLLPTQLGGSFDGGQLEPHVAVRVWLAQQPWHWKAFVII